MYSSTFKIRKASKQDATLIFDFIYQLAVYEKMESDVKTSPEELTKALFENQYAQVLIAEEETKPVGFALYFFNFSTFLGRPGLYLEDLFVDPAYRGKGYGKALLIELSRIAKSKNCGRMEWSVLKWNTPSIEFYKSLGAKEMEEWSVYRLEEDELKSLAQLG
ncbi:GNAT family N-acetyltransferase [Planobacterium oryzisoli]|uniref:GNAT family N-acetyltransferase n=1 Tax=Planobacterium oryzisoli TaxID=2771435 RepID=A0A930YU05_9FLAO|nr:GNAT family N-acetyltransferase [Planobacterium oryzisoli]MBF5026340.1 GNAT family N-acetyltransferase [Planobacterium oryzisoli]